MALSILQQSLAHHTLQSKAHAPLVQLGQDKPALSPRTRTYYTADPATANSPLAHSFTGGGHPGYWEQAREQGKTPLKSLHTNQSTTPEGRAISAASTTRASITNPPSVWRQTSKNRAARAVLKCLCREQNRSLTASKWSTLSSDSKPTGSFGTSFCKEASVPIAPEGIKQWARVFEYIKHQ